MCSAFEVRPLYAAGPDEVRGSAPIQVIAFCDATSHWAGFTNPGSTVRHQSLSTSPISLDLLDVPALTAADRPRTYCLRQQCPNDLAILLASATAASL